jgi:hypothetical protein
MTCRADVKKLIYDDIYNEFAKNRYTIVRVNDNTFRIANQQSTKGKSRAEHLRQATLIANEIKSRVYGKYGNNVDVNIEVPYYVGFPVEMTIEPLPEYIETVYAQVKPEKRTEFLTDLAFTFDPALYQQELMEDSPLKMIPYEVYEAQEKARLKEEAERKAREAKEEALKKITIDEKGQFLLFQKPSTEGEIASEKTIRDLAARMSARIGIPYRIISDRTQEFKGKLEGNVAVINLAYTTLDTPIHEILGHPIIRAIKNKTYSFELDGVTYGQMDDAGNIGKGKYYKGREEISKEEFERLRPVTLYDNLLKELEYGKGKEVLDRIKKDYNKKFERGKSFTFEGKEYIADIASSTGYRDKYGDDVDSNELETALFAYELINKDKIYYNLEEQQEEALVELLGLMTAEKLDAVKDIKLISLLKQLLGRIKAFVRDIILQKEVNIDSLPDNMTIGDLASVLAYSNSKLILPGYEVEYTTPDNMKFKTYAEASNHISELAKSVKNVDLSGVRINKELSKEELDKISELEQLKQKEEKYFESKEYQEDKAKKLKELNDKLSALENKKIVFKTQEPTLDAEDRNKYGFKEYDYVRVESSYSRTKTIGLDGPLWQKYFGKDFEGYYIHGYNTEKGKPDTKVLKITKEQAENIWKKQNEKNPLWGMEVKDQQEQYRLKRDISEITEDSSIKYKISNLEREIESIKTGELSIQNFIKKNKEYEQSKEIIEEWKKVNNIQYNPEEIYSRGQEFSSVVGAYSNFDVNLMMQNLLSHIEDNEKAGGKFAISAYTKPVDKQIGHLEGGGGKIKFKIYPQSKDILWAANTDVYSGSVWDASEKVNKDKKSELLGVSYTKYPSLSNVNNVQPNLASIIDDLAHHHNELGISLTGNNFRLEYDEDIPYQTKKIIDSVNAILDQKYGKVVKPEIKKFKKQTILIDNPLPENQRSGVLSYSSDVGGGYFLDTAYGFERRGYASGNRIPYWQVEKILKIAYPNSVISLQFYTNKVLVDGEDIVTYSGLKYETPNKIEKEVTGIQPTQTNDNLKESIDSVKSKIVKYEYGIEDELGMSEFTDTTSKYKSEKEYTSQALINTRIAALKETAKKYPRSLIRSEVKRVSGMAIDDVPFQKIPSTPIKPGVSLLPTVETEEKKLLDIPDIAIETEFQQKHCK